MKAISKNKDSYRGSSGALLPLPAPAEKAIGQLASNIALARRRRGLTQASLAERIGASLNTVKRMEKGDVRIPLHFIARTLHVFGEIDSLAHLLDTSEDELGLALMNERLPKRVRTPRVSSGAL